MDHQIQQIANRLKELRLIDELSLVDAAKIGKTDETTYQEYESGQTDIPVGVLHQMAAHFNIELTTLLTGEEPKMNSYFITRKDKGASVQRRQDYQYQSLADGFRNRKAEPFIVQVKPCKEDLINLNTHPGHEFNYILEGSITFRLDKKMFTLESGDSIYFDSGIPHGMSALNQKPARFLAVIC